VILVLILAAFPDSILLTATLVPMGLGGSSSGSSLVLRYLLWLLLESSLTACHEQCSWRDVELFFASQIPCRCSQCSGKVVVLIEDQSAH
jgi:hypothetical protein